MSNEELIADARGWTAAVSTYPGAGHFIRKLANALEDVEEQLVDANQTLVELRTDPVLVEGSWFQIATLPEVLGNYIRGADAHARDAKAAWIKAEEQAKQLTSLEAGVEQLCSATDTETYEATQAWLVGNLRALLTSTDTPAPHETKEADHG